MSKSCFLGFGFYGAGNVGDDLMLKGFFDVFDRCCNTQLKCILEKKRIPSQKKRFSQVEWLPANSVERVASASSCDFWLGVGGTPFQASSGRWLLNKIKQDIDSLGGMHKWMIGVGCEDEVLREKVLACQVAEHMNHIWARDEKSRNFLIGSLGVNDNKVSSGGDLAHIALRKIFSVEDKCSRDNGAIGIVYYAEDLNSSNLAAIKQFASKLSREKPVTFLANDVRREKGFEYSVYKSMFGGFANIGRSRPHFFSPDYNVADVATLVSHYRGFDIVMASRYHAILAAAWAGCRVVVIDRSSKVRMLANELNLPLVESPFSVDALYKGHQEAERVPRVLLEEKAVLAEQSVIALCNLIACQ